METPSYRENAKMKSNNFRDEQVPPLERALWWIEYILRNKNAAFMSSPVKHLNVLQRQSIDIIAFLTVVTVILFFIFYYIIKHFFKYLMGKIFQRNSNSKQKTE